MQIPKREDMHWLLTETQEDVNDLYSKYEELNKKLIPMHELYAGEEYQYMLAYVTDTGVLPSIIEALADSCGRVVAETGDIVKVPAILKAVDHLFGYLTIPNAEKGVKLCFGNYGRCWRLWRRF